MMKRIARMFSLLQEFLDLLLSYRANCVGMKTFGTPNFKGGPSTKFDQLRPITKKKLEPYSTIYCISAVKVPLFALRILKRMGTKIVVNQNGVFYPLWAGSNYLAQNDYLRDLNELSDHSFFQSKFALESYTRWVGPPPKNHSISYNAVELARFSKENRSTALPEKIRILFFIDISPFTRKTWEEYLSFMRHMQRKGGKLYDKIEWVFMGRIFSYKLFKELEISSLENRYKADLVLDPTPTQVMETLSSSHAAFHLVFNDVCPNKVLEAMAAGVWVMCTSSGGSAELVGEESGAILPVEHGYEEASYPSFESMEKALESFVRDSTKNREYLTNRIASFSIERWHDDIISKQKNLY